MSITDELRGFARRWPCTDYIHKDMLAIADRIDAEHERICYDYQREHDDWVYIRDTCWVELPKDADGVPIHVGDVMEWVDPDGEVTVTCTVDAVGVGCFFAWDNANTRFAQKCANAYRHHAPTVEDVLREMLYKAHIYDEREMELLPDLIADYAKRLTLAEGEDA